MLAGGDPRYGLKMIRDVVRILDVQTFLRYAVVEDGRLGTGEDNRPGAGSSWTISYKSGSGMSGMTEASVAEDDEEVQA